jgi:RHS repeat-associated protein
LGGIVAEVYFWDGWQTVEETDVSGTLQRQYVYGEGLDEVVRANLPDASDVDGDLNTTEKVDLFFHHNSLGSVVAVTDAAGTVKESYRYSAFGQPTIFNASGVEVASSAVKQPFLFTGARWDEESSLYQMRLRYYDPVAGRFVSRDPLGMWGDAAQNGNGQAYCGHDPVNFVDPMGLDAIDDIIAGTDTISQDQANGIALTAFREVVDALRAARTALGDQAPEELIEALAEARSVVKGVENSIFMAMLTAGSAGARGTPPGYIRDSAEIAATVGPWPLYLIPIYGTGLAYEDFLLAKYEFETNGSPQSCLNYINAGGAFGLSLGGDFALGAGLASKAVGAGRVSVGAVQGAGPGVVRGGVDPAIMHLGTRFRQWNLLTECTDEAGDLAGLAAPLLEESESMPGVVLRLWPTETPNLAGMKRLRGCIFPRNATPERVFYLGQYHDVYVHPVYGVMDPWFAPTPIPWSNYVNALTEATGGGVRVTMAPPAAH